MKYSAKKLSRRPSPKRLKKRLFVIYIGLCLFSAGSWSLNAPHNGSITCDDCHGAEGEASEPIVARTAEEQETLCRSCHYEGGPASSREGLYQFALHTVESAGETIVIRCGACHDPHGPSETTDPHTGQSTDNLFLIRSNTNDYVSQAVGSAIYQPNQVPQEPNTFVFNEEPLIGICQTCHQNTSYWKNNETIQEPLHNYGVACTDCHKHDIGFKPDCDSCHDYPPTSGEHSQHLAASGYDWGIIDCDTCHYNNNHDNGSVDIAGTGSLASLSYNGDFCSNACHTAAVVGGNPLTCPDCHGGASMGGGSGHGVSGNTILPQTMPTLIPEPDLETDTATLVTLEWNETPASYGPPSYAEYYIQIDDDPAFGSINYNSGWVMDTNWSNNFDTVGTWYWRIRARDAVRPFVISDWADDSFTVNSSSTPVLSPQPDFDSGYVAQDITLQWSVVTDPGGAPIEYELQWYDWNSVDQTIVTSATEYTLSTYCSGWYWRVRSHNTVSGSLSPWSPTDYFQDISGCGGSCPFLYVWDGSSFEFGTDLNGPGKLATLSSSGYFKPNPNDYYVLQTEPVEIDGYYEMRLVEERYEVNYLDQLRVFAVDLPADREVYAEKPSFTTPYNGYEQHLHTASTNPAAPVSVQHVNKELDVSDVTSASDQDYLILNEDRNVGFDYQTIELDLGDLSGAPQIKLIIDGMSAFPNTPKGTEHAGNFGPRTKLEVLDENGDWVRVSSSTAVLPKLPEFKRPFALDITNIFVSNQYKVRLTFLFKTYVDSIRVDITADVPVSLTELTLVNADLRSYGHSVEVPLIDDIFEYSYLDEPNNEHNYYPGNYTRFGEVKQLLETVDDQFVIYGNGDELALRFSPPGEASAGTTRKFLIYSNSYYKDAKSNVPATVEPLPFASMSNFPYDEAVENYPNTPVHQLYQETYNTRATP